MKAVGIICEYNPFHNGHLLHLEKVKELFPKHLIILVLNGYFLERGEISLISKEDKVKIALQNNIDLVMELPFVFGSQSADIFANTAITILEKLQCEYVVFGSEINDVNVLTKLVKKTLKEDNEYNSQVKNYLDAGFNYPTSLAKALNINFTLKSNDLLGFAYIKSILLNNYHIKPLTIKRTNDYLDTTSKAKVISAQNIRKKLLNNEDIKKYVPACTLKYLHPISFDDYFKILKYKILTANDLSSYLDVDEGIENRLKKIILKVDSFNELLEALKTKRYTYNKLRRMLIHILIGLTKSDNQKITLDYCKVLGFNTKGQNYLGKIKKELAISLTPLKDSLLYSYELKSAYLYDLITSSNAVDFEKSTKPIKFK